MIQFEEFTLNNGLQVIVHEDSSTPMAAVNILYNVGSKDEDPERTGFAHLFEHLMFSGSKHIPSFDEVVQSVGGENNAYTSLDVTNFYTLVPAINLETAFWLESDRMASLNISEAALEKERKVVIEEFKQRYLNQPYGDLWLKLRPLCYQVHPYRWPTIGKDIAHIEQAKLENVQAFFDKFYHPNQAILCVAGNVTSQQVRTLAEKWFGDIPAGAPYKRQLPEEPVQTQERKLTVRANVPYTVIVKAYKMRNKAHPDYPKADMLNDILGQGKSSRLYDKLVKGASSFNTVNSYLTGSLEDGLLVINGKLHEGAEIEQAEKEIDGIIAELQLELVSEQELQKVKNQAEASLVFSEMEILTKAMNLSYAKLMGDTNRINSDLELLQQVTREDIRQSAREILRPENCSTLYYLPSNSGK
ncbi:MAG: insulinase family protein [Cytophagales bacterium]|nr:insulinase family protein [Cytophagales bacterium]